MVRGQGLPKSGFKRFLESEAKKKPLKVEGRVNKKEVLKKAKLLADRIKDEDLEMIKRFWEERNYDVLTIILRKYGLEFKGIVYIQELIKEFLKIVEKPEDS